MRHEYRVRWRSSRRDDNGDVIGRWRYGLRQDPHSAERLADALMSQSDEDHCTCSCSEHECGWCRGDLLPATEISVSRRVVGDWEACNIGRCRRLDLLSQRGKP